MKRFTDYLILAAIVASTFGICWAWNTSNHLQEEAKKERILEQRRNKIDSQKITKSQMIEQYVQQ